MTCGPRTLASGRLLAVFAVVALAVLSCGRALEPRNRVIEACEDKCNARASRQCSESECHRGCEFILDRLVEHEGDPVIACVARAQRRCSDVVWADCAVHVGVHADGGPPAPPPPPEED